MSSLPNLSIATQRNGLDSQTETCDVHSQRNAHLPVAALCADVLLQIFEDATEDSLCDIMEMRVRLTHICRSWRHLALATPIFWSDIYFGSWRQRECLLECFLERSKSTQLQVIVGHLCWITSFVIERVLIAQKHRIGSLRLLDPAFIVSQPGYEFWETLDEHPPALVRLKVEGYTSHRERQQFRKLSAAFPSLRTLEVVIEPYGPSLVLAFSDLALTPALTSLIVAYNEILDSQATSSWFTVLEKLRPLCDLRTLSLCNVMGLQEHNITETGNVRSSSDKTTVAFPYLRSLTLKGTSEGQISFLRSLVLPVLTQAEVDIPIGCLDSYTVNFLLDKIFPTLRQAFLSSPTQGSLVAVTFEQVVKLDHHSSRDMNLSFRWSTNTRSEGDFSMPDFPIGMKTLWPLPYHSSVQVMMKARRDDYTPAYLANMQEHLNELYVQGIPALDNIGMFVIKGERSMPSYNVLPSKTIRAMSALRVLCFHDLVLPRDHVKSVFAQYPDRSHPFHHLHTLQFSGIAIKSNLLNNLEAVLKAREAADIRSLRLVFVECTIAALDTSIASMKHKLDHLADIEFHSSGLYNGLAFNVSNVSVNAVEQEEEEANSETIDEDYDTEEHEQDDYDEDDDTGEDD